MKSPMFCARAILVASALLAVSTSVFPCPYTFREAGFILREAAPYRLCLLVKSDTPGQDALAQWLGAAADDLLREFFQYLEREPGR